METWQRDHIRKNLPELLENTVVNEALLSILQTSNLLSGDEIGQFEAKIDELEKTYLLYDILETRVDAYNGLITALQYTKQTGAFRILKDPSPQTSMPPLASSIDGFQKVLSTKRTFFSNLELHKNTRVDEHLLAYFYSKGILTDGDREEIISWKIQFERVRKLYEVLDRRTCAYEDLLEALKKCNQSGAVKILLDDRLQTIPEPPPIQTELPSRTLTKPVFSSKPDLIENTIVNGLLLSHFQASNLLDMNEVDQVEHVEKVPFEKAHFLYCMLEEKSNAYDALLTALQETNQTKAAQILLNAASKKFTPSLTSILEESKSGLSDITTETALLGELCRKTIVNRFLLSHLQENNLLSRQDVDKLLEKELPIERADLLYFLLEGRVDVLDGFINALQRTNQTRAAQLLLSRTQHKLTQPPANIKKTRRKSFPTLTRFSSNLNLVKCTQVSTALVAHLHASNLLSKPEVEEIMREKVPFEKADLFYSVLETRVNAFDELLKALQATRQIYAAHILLSEYQQPITQTILDITEQSKSIFTDKRIANSLVELVKNTNVNRFLLSHLQACNLLLRPEVDDIAAERNDAKKATNLYETLQTKCNAYNRLVRALQETNQTVAAKLLLEEPQDVIISPSAGPKESAIWNNFLSNLNLMKSTHVNIALLTQLHYSNLLSKPEVDKIMLERVSAERTYQLYRILETRLDAFDGLLRALVGTNQTEVVQILLNNHQQGITSASQKPVELSGAVFNFKDSELLGKLIRLTKVNRLLLSHLQASNILSRSDMNEIDAERKQSAKAKKLFEILSTRIGAYDLLVKALEESNQTGAVAILLSVHKKDSTQPQNFFTTNNVFSNILLNENLVLVSTLNVHLTNQKIKTIFFKATVRDAKEFLSTRNADMSFHHSSTGSETLDANVCILFLESQKGEECCKQNLYNFLTCLGKAWKPNPIHKIFVVVQLRVIDIYDCVEKHVCSANSDFPNAIEIIDDHFTMSQIEPSFWETLLTRKVYDQGKPVTLKSFCLSYHYDNQHQFYDRFCRGKFMIDLINYEKPPVVLRQTVPNTRTGYIKRRLRSRSHISHLVFEKAGNENLLVFMESDKHEELERFLEKHRVECFSFTEYMSPSNHISSKHAVILQTEKELKILITREHTFFHVLEVHNDKLYWIKTVGEIDFIQAHVCPNTEQSVLSDYELHDRIQNVNYCILGDSAGMGKSVLLAWLAQNAQKEKNNRVFYYVMSDFIKAMQVKLNGVFVDNGSILKALLDVIRAYASEYQVDEIMFDQQELVKYKQIIFLDGLDEVEDDTMGFAFRCIRVLRQDLPHLQLRITVRPHLLCKLEQNLATLGFNVEPFNEADQSSFLTRYWANERIVRRQAVNNDGLNTFAQHCLNEIQSALSGNEQNIAGVPLQCLLIAEVFEKEAEVFADPQNTCVNMHSLGIKSLGELYDKMIIKKCTVYESRHLEENVCVESILCLHTYLAISILFDDTDWPKNLRPFLLHENLFQEYKSMKLKDWTANFEEFQNESLPYQEVFKIGVVENWGEDHDTPKLQFLHRTFAEYLVAKFAVKQILSSDPYAQSFYIFISNAVLQTCESNVGNNILRSPQEKMHKFKYPVICQFVNTILQSKQISKLNAGKFALVCKGWKAVAWASAHENWLKIFELIRGRLNEANIEDQHWILSQLGSTSHLYYFMKRPIFSAALLCLSVARGDKSMIDELSKYDGSKELLKEAELLIVIKACVTNSTHQSQSIIETKLSMLQTLITDMIKPETLPVFETNIHVDILLFLVERISTVDLIEMVDKQDKTILHKPAEYLSLSDYEKLVSRLEQDHGLLVKKLSVCRDLFGQTPLHTVIRHMEPTHRLLNTLIGTEHNYMDSGGYNIVWAGLRYRKSIECIDILIKCANEHKHEQVDRFGRTILHIAAQHCTNDTLEHLISRNPQLLDYINQPDIYGNTPSFYALDSVSPSGTIRTLHYKKAKLTHQNKVKQTLLQIATEMENTKVIKLLSEQIFD